MNNSTKNVVIGDDGHVVHDILILLWNERIYYQTVLQPEAMALLQIKKVVPLSIAPHGYWWKIITTHNDDRGGYYYGIKQAYSIVYL